MTIECSIIDQLEEVRRNIESRFILAGGLLERAIDVIGKQVESLDGLIRAISDQGVEDTAADLLGAAARLSELPASQATRRARVTDLCELSLTLRKHIDEMRITLKYLRVFAFNMKIAAAGSALSAASFSGFTEEVLDRIDLGLGELALIDRQLADLQAQLNAAMAIGVDLDAQCSRMLPAVPTSLSADAAAIAGFHQRTGVAAAQVAGLARNIQQKVAAALMSLQIGDITRQRIEHVQAGLGMVETWDFGVPDEDAARALRCRFFAMLADQMEDIIADFHRDTSRMMKNLSGLAADSVQAMKFQEDAVGGDGRADLRGLEGSVALAVELVNDVEAATQGANDIGRSTGLTVQGLVQRVGAIKTVRADVQRMAINASLRCNRLGDVGKPLIVIATELGDHAGRLDRSADVTLEALDGLDRAASDLAQSLEGQGNEAEISFAGRLQGSLDRLRDAADVVDRDLAELAVRGDAVAQTLGRTGDHLRLEQDLGEVLAQAAEAVRAQAGHVSDETFDASPGYDRLMAQIHALYTMARERTVHARHLGTPAEDAAQVEEDDVDLLVANALF